MHYYVHTNMLIIEAVYARVSISIDANLEI